MQSSVLIEDRIRILAAIKQRSGQRRRSWEGEGLKTGERDAEGAAGNGRL
jgi:hypothetical protein